MGTPHSPARWDLIDEPVIRNGVVEYSASPPHGPWTGIGVADRIRIAAVQTAVTIDPANNAKAIHEAMRQAANAGARLAHFPEGALSGYAGQAKALMATWQVDWAAIRRELRRTAALAGQLGIWVVIGGNHQLTPPHRPHNSLWIINDQGQLVDRYDKCRRSRNWVRHEVARCE